MLSDTYAAVYQSRQAGCEHQENLDFRVRLVPSIQVQLFASPAPANNAAKMLKAELKEYLAGTRQRSDL